MSTRTKTRKRRTSAIWIIAGVLLLLYPIVATLINDAVIRKQAESYADSVQAIDPPAERARLIDAAHRYNADLARSGHHAMPPEPSSPGFDYYMNTLAPAETGGVMARLTIDSIDVDLPVYHGTNPDVLYDGAGHMFGSSLPVGGLGTNSVITAHTGMVNASMFDHLPLLKDGAIVTVDVLDQRLYYKVTGRKIVKPDEWQEVTYEPGRDKLTLITCTPYGINTDRLLVEADRVDAPVDDAGAHWRLPLSWWMILNLILIALALLTVFLVERRRRAARKQRAAAAEAVAGAGEWANRAG